MRVPFSTLVAALALFSLGWLATGISKSTAQAPGAAPGRTQWEYRIEDASALSPALLNQSGANGWELVTVAHTRGDTLAVYKRPKG